MTVEESSRRPSSMRKKDVGGRARLLEAALPMFTQRGFANVGINEVTEVAGVARMTLYNNFASKEALVLAVYEDLMAATLTEIPADEDKGEEERVLALFSYFERKAEDGGDRGCPFVHASLQTSEPQGDVFALVTTYKQKLRHVIFESLLSTRSNRGELADQLLLLLDGAAIEMYLKGALHPGRSARRAAVTLLRATPEQKHSRS